MIEPHMLQGGASVWFCIAANALALGLASGACAGTRLGTQGIAVSPCRKSPFRHSRARDVTIIDIPRFLGCVEP